MTVRQLSTERVNGQPVWRGPQDEAVLVTHGMQAEHVVESPVAFQQQVVVDHLSVEGETLLGLPVRTVQQDMATKRLLEEQTKGFRQLVDVVGRATRQPSAKEQGGECIACGCAIIFRGLRWVMSLSCSAVVRCP